MILRVRPVTAIVFGLFVLGTTLSAQAYVLYGSEENPEAYLRWFEPRMSYVLDSQESQDISFDVAESQINESFQTWGQLTCENVSTPYDFTYDGVVTGRTIGFDSDARENNENLVLWVQSANQWVHPPSVLALTSLTYDTGNGEIVDADIEINDAGFVFSADGAAGKIDLRNTIVHEVGHILGLDHSLSLAATMYDKAPPGETKKRDLEADDIDGFCALYGPNKFPIPSKGDNIVKSGSGCAVPGEPEEGLGGWAVVLLGLCVLGIMRGRRATGWHR